MWCRHRYPTGPMSSTGPARSSLAGKADAGLRRSERDDHLLPGCRRLAVSATQSALTRIAPSRRGGSRHRPTPAATLRRVGGVHCFGVLPALGALRPPFADAVADPDANRWAMPAHALIHSRL